MAGLLTSLLGSLAYQPQANPGAGYDVDELGNYIGPDGKVVTDPSKQNQLDGTSSAPFVQPSWWQRALSPTAAANAQANAEFEAAPAYANQKYNIGQQIGARDYANLPSSIQAGLINPATATTLTGGNFSAPSVYAAMTDKDRADADIPAKATQAEGSQYGYDDQYYKNLWKEQEGEAQLGVPAGRASVAAAAIPADVAQYNRTAANVPLAAGIENSNLQAEKSRLPFTQGIANNEAARQYGLTGTALGLLPTEQDTMSNNATKADFESSLLAPTAPYALRVKNGEISSPELTGTSVPGMYQKYYDTGMNPDGTKVADPFAAATVNIPGIGNVINTDHAAYRSPNAAPEARVQQPAPSEQYQETKHRPTQADSTEGLLPSLYDKTTAGIGNILGSIPGAAQRGYVGGSNLMSALAGGNYRSQTDQPTTSYDIAIYKMQHGLPLNADEKQILGQ